MATAFRQLSGCGEVLKVAAEEEGSDQQSDDAILSTKEGSGIILQMCLGVENGKSPTGKTGRMNTISDSIFTGLSHWG